MNGSDGGQDHISPGTDVAVDATPDLPTDLPPDAPPFAGSRSFVVTSRLERDGGIGTPVTAHIFTMVLDSERRHAIVGAAGEGGVHALEPLAGGALRFPQPVRFTLPASCPGSSVTYNDLRFAIGASGGLTGTGEGQLLVFLGDAGTTTTVTMSLDGVTDAQSPRLTTVGEVADPFAPFTLISSEPLLPGTAIMLRAPSGETIELPASGLPGSFVIQFQKPPQVLRYGTQYTFVAGPIADFAGNAPFGIAAETITTQARPPLAAEDGFEGVTTTTFGGVRVLSGAGTPTISGATSLYIPSVGSGMTQPPLALRLQVSPGDRSIRFSYRTVPGAPADFTAGAAFAVGSEGGTFTAPTLPPDPGTPTTTGMIDGGQVTLGPILTATFALPTDATTEVVLARKQQLFMICGAPIPTIAGIIIDDLRVE